MSDKNTKMFFQLLRKQEKVFNKLLSNANCTPEDRQMIVLCLTELYFSSQRLIGLIKKISETNLDFTERDLDSLLGNLIDLRIETYDEINDRIKDLKKPLKTVINKICDLGAEKYGWE